MTVRHKPTEWVFVGGVFLWCVGMGWALTYEPQGWVVGILLFWPNPVLLLWIIADRIAVLIGEEGGIERRIRAVQRDTRLLAKRGELEQAEAKYRAEFTRYVESA